VQDAVCRLYIAISVDGYIATREAGSGWFPPFKANAGLEDFMEQVATVVIGRRSYEQLLGLETWPLEGKRVVVLTSEPVAGVESWNGAPQELLALLRKQGSGDIWLLGGSKVVRQWLDLELIDRLELYLTPTLLGDGMRLFAPSPHQQDLQLDSATTWPGGVTCLRYTLNAH